MDDNDTWLHDVGMVPMKFQYPWIVESGASIASAPAGVDSGLGIPAIWSNVENGVQLSAAFTQATLPGEIAVVVKVYVPAWQQHVDLGAALKDRGVPLSVVARDKATSAQYVREVVEAISSMLGGAPHLAD